MYAGNLQYFIYFLSDAFAVPGKFRNVPFSVVKELKDVRVCAGDFSMNEIYVCRFMKLAGGNPAVRTYEYES